MFSRAQSASWGLSHTESRKEALQRLGVENTSTVTYRVAAEQATAKLGAGLEVTAESLGEALADDLRLRAEEAADFANYLPESGDELDESLARYEVWSKHAADEDVLELAARIDPIQRARNEGLDDVPEEYLAEAQEASKAFVGRMRELERTLSPTVSMGLIDQAREAADQLSKGSDIATVMTNYHELDRRLSVLEEYLSEAVASYDRYINEQVDAAREERHR